MSGRGGPFWRRKVKTFATRFDFDGNGYLTRDDFHRLAALYAKIGNPTPSKAKRMREILNEVWDKYYEEASKKQRLTPDAFADAIQGPGDAAACAEFFNLMFDVLDVNDDNNIDRSEFGLFHKIMGITDARLTAETFDAIDTNKDGVISREEFVAAGHEYWDGADEQSPYRFLYGPLLD